MKHQPKINVGILSAKKVLFSLHHFYTDENGKDYRPEQYEATFKDDKIVLKQNEKVVFEEKQIRLTAKKNDANFELNNVVIGVNFHWEQTQNQTLEGDLHLIIENEKITAINVIDIEKYLKSVISSEMSATSSLELLKAHAIISRSWLLSQIEKQKMLQNKTEDYVTEQKTDNEIIKWYDREDHANFDVCADDHCQRYQGITKILSDKAIKAVQATAGEVLLYNEAICDARFSKCCGGVVESFENVWEPVRHPYLQKVIDNDKAPDGFDTNLTVEKNTEKWILSNPPAFCNTTNKKILSQVLPDFDQATTDFYRWQVEYSQKELSALIKKRSGIDFGAIIELQPIERGESGRLIKLKIIGTKKTITVGKELEIRKWLSESHLYSSAFVAEYQDITDKIPQKFILKGAGWGHGVGLCQIGAAVMGENGYSYQQILHHYFIDATITKIY